MNAKLEIQNLKCGGCAHTITTKISAFENVSEVAVNVETSEISFGYDTEATLELVVEKLKQLGYPVEGADNNGLLKAKSFVSCAIGKVTK